MFTGSSAIEAACKQIVAQRAKQSGMHWSVSRAASIIALRCQHARQRPMGRTVEPPVLRPPRHQPRCSRSSDRQYDSDTQARTTTKIIPNNPVLRRALEDIRVNNRETSGFRRCFMFATPASFGHDSLAETADNAGVMRFHGLPWSCPRPTPSVPGSGETPGATVTGGT